MANQKQNRGKVIFRTWKIDKKTGKKMYARDYGYKAWPIYLSSSKDK